MVLINMESSSIVSFNNDSTYQCTLKGDYNNFNVHELALHAMRDRCLLLQRRINALESDNVKLKLDITRNESSGYHPLQEEDRFLLRQKIAELNKQKSQLLHYVFMVSCENKNLWSKIAALNGPDKISAKEHVKQPLIRTNTYIHSTPKQNMLQEKFSETSLEEISLKLINSYKEEKSQLVEQYEQMIKLQDEDDAILNVDSIGFTFMEDACTDSLKELQSQIEKLQLSKKEVAQQEEDLKILISRIESLLNDGYKCSTCTMDKGKHVKMEDKQTEISNSLVNFATQTDSYLFDDIMKVHTSENMTIHKDEDNNTNQEIFGKICPMCGETFRKDVSFSDFQTHVENHFIGETETDSLENDTQDSFDNIN